MGRVVTDLDTATWGRRLSSMQRFPLTDVGFVFDESLDRQVNSSGGAIEFPVSLALTHRVEDCDALPVVQMYGAKLRKPSSDGTLTMTSLFGPDDDISPAPWDVGKYEAVEGDHVVLAALPDDLQRARAGLASIDAGIADAMRLIPPPRGTSKLFVALADAGNDLFGAGGLIEAAGVSMAITYVDPKDAARTGRGAQAVGGPSGSGEKAPLAGGRIVLHPDAFAAPGRLRSVALHEAVHALANQWASYSDAWVAEGLAEWCELGFSKGLRADAAQRALVKRTFGGFRSRLTRDGGDAVAGIHFYDDSVRDANYACAAAVYAYLEDSHDRAAAFRFARLAYQQRTEDAVKAVGGGSLAGLAGDVEGWVKAL